MKILFDQGTPAPLRHHLPGHEVCTVFELGWSMVKNGELPNLAESHGFDVFVTTDTNLKHQQNLGSRRLAIAVLLSTSWPRMLTKTPGIAAYITGLAAGGFVEIPV